MCLCEIDVRACVAVNMRESKRKIRKRERGKEQKRGVEKDQSLLVKSCQLPNQTNSNGTTRRGEDKDQPFTLYPSRGLTESPGSWQNTDSSRIVVWFSPALSLSHFLFLLPLSVFFPGMWVAEYNSNPGVYSDIVYTCWAPMRLGIYQIGHTWQTERERERERALGLGIGNHLAYVMLLQRANEPCFSIKEPSS